MAGEINGGLGVRAKESLMLDWVCVDGYGDMDGSGERGSVRRLWW